jgi:hypothetical protein
MVRHLGGDVDRDRPASAVVAIVPRAGEPFANVEIGASPRPPARHRFVVTSHTSTPPLANPLARRSRYDCTRRTPDRTLEHARSEDAPDASRRRGRTPAIAGCRLDPVGVWALPGTCPRARGACPPLLSLRWTRGSARHLLPSGTYGCGCGANRADSSGISQTPARGFDTAALEASRACACRYHSASARAVFTVRAASTLPTMNAAIPPATPTRTTTSSGVKSTQGSWALP